MEISLLLVIIQMKKVHFAVGFKWLSFILNLDWSSERHYTELSLSSWKVWKVWNLHLSEWMKLWGTVLFKLSFWHTIEFWNSLITLTLCTFCQWTFRKHFDKLQGYRLIVWCEYMQAFYSSSDSGLMDIKFFEGLKATSVLLWSGFSLDSYPVALLFRYNRNQEYAKWPEDTKAKLSSRITSNSRKDNKAGYRSLVLIYERT